MDVVDVKTSAEDIPADLWGWVTSEVGEPVSVSAPAAGSYNLNYVLVLPSSTKLVLRVPKTHAREVDLRVLREADVLRGLGDPQASFAPSMAAEGPGGALLIEFVGTDVLDDVTVRRGPVAAFELAQITDAMVDLHASTRGLEGTYARHLAVLGMPNGHTYEVNRRHLLATWHQAWKCYEGTLRNIGLPSPHQLAKTLSADLGTREPGLLHGDVHRKNLRTDRAAQRLYLIDWEMAQIGDPVYDLAVAVWKLKLPMEQEKQLLEDWSTALPVTSTTGWQSALRSYVRQETIKTACVHFIRALDRIDLRDEALNAAVASDYAANLQDASGFLRGVETDPNRILSELQILATREAEQE